jgi:glucose/arabinose dehydrogenase
MNHIFTPFRLQGRIMSLFFIFFFTYSLQGQLPAGFIDAKVQGGYTTPMGVIFSKNGLRMFVWEKQGTLWLSTWNGTTYIKQATPVLDISEEVGNWRDFGLQSFALDPNFDTNGLIYLFYQVDRHHLLKFGTPQYSSTTDEYLNATISRLTRYKLNTVGSVLSVDNTSRKVLLGETKSTGVPLTHESHGGGQIVFGADGTLLVSTGDNASFNQVDAGSSPDTYFQQAVTDGIMRSTENVGAFRSQMINSFCGKVLRMDPNTGDGIPSNPYYNSASPRSAQSRVWALGFRNPYRMCFKTGTGSTSPADANPGTLLVGDVQWDAWEELHIIEKGGINCGWPLYEGLTLSGGYYDTNARNAEEVGNPTFLSLLNQATSLTVDPIPSQRRYRHFPPAIDWAHYQNDARYPDFTTGELVAKTIGTAGAAVTGSPFKGNAATSGTYYTGTAFPAAYRDVYFFADYGANWIKAAVLHDNSDHQIHSVLNFAPDGHGNGIVDLEYCPLDQSVFYVNINTGDIQKISYGSGNRPPIAAISANKTSGPSPLAVIFSSAGSSDPDGNPITYQWNFGDGSAISTLANPSHTFSATGSKGFTVTLTVKDNLGLTDSKTLTISVNNTAPSVKITNPLNNAKYSLAQATNYTLGSTVTDTDPAGMQYAWQVSLRHNNHEHREPVNNQQSPTVVISPVGCSGETYYYLIELTVKDNGGLTAKDSVKIYPDCTTANLDIKNLTPTALQNSVRLNWTNPTVVFDEVMVVAKQGTGFLTNPSGTTYTANASFIGNGSDFEGGKVVYKGVAAAVTVTNLFVGDLYYFRVFTRKGTAWTGGIEISATPRELGCLKGSYFNNVNLTGTPTVVRAESTINYLWAANAPVTGINADNFSVRWEGNLFPTVSGTYTFTVIADDGVRLWVNNTQIIDKWFDQTAAVRYTATINLTAGQNIPIKMEYYERTGLATARLLWTEPGAISSVVFFNACSVASTVGSFDPLKCYKLTSRFNNKVVEIADASVIAGANVQQGIFIDGQKYQLWKLQVNGDATYRIMNLNSGKVADVFNDALTSGSPIGQWDWNTGTNQRWFFNRNTEGYYKITAKHSNLALAVPNNSTVDGTQLVQTTSNTTTSQQWTVAEATCPADAPVFDANKCYKLTSRVSNKVMEVAGASLASGANIQQGTFIAGQDNQFWKLQTNNDGSYRMMNLNSGKVADVFGDALNAGAPIGQWDWNTGNNQRWIFTLNTSGYYKIVAKHSNLALEVPNNSTADGTQLVQNTPNTTTAQQWTVAEATCPAEAVVFDPNKCYKLTSRNSTNVMQVAGASLVEGADLQQGTLIAGQKHQLWKLQTNGDGSYRMLNTNSGLVADVYGDALNPNAPVVHWGWNTGTNQRWKFTKNIDGYYKIVVTHSNFALAVLNASTANGAQLVQNTPNGSFEQQWKVDEVVCPAGVASLVSSDILSINAYRDGKKGVITWLSTINHNKDYFVIERLNSTVFEKLDVVNTSYGKVGETQYYSFTDSEPNESENFYRIALYRDGATQPQYSKVVSLDFSHFKDYLLFPNPTSDYIDIDLENVHTRSVDITITDVAGKILKQQRIDVVPIAPVRISLENMQNGAYFMRIEAKGKRASLKQFFIMR